MNVNLDNLKNRGSVNKLQLNLSLQCFKRKTQFLVIGAAGQWSCWNTVRFLVKSPFSPFLIDLQIFVPRMNSQFLFWCTFCAWIFIVVLAIYMYAPGLQLLSRERFSCSKLQVLFFLVQHILTLAVSGFACLLRIYKLSQSSRVKINVCICDRKKEKSQLFWSNNAASSFENCTNLDWNGVSWCVQAGIYNHPGPENKASTPRTCREPGGLQSQRQNFVQPYQGPAAHGLMRANGTLAILFKKNIFELKVC